MGKYKKKGKPGGVYIQLEKAGEIGNASFDKKTERGLKEIDILEAIASKPFDFNVGGGVDMGKDKKKKKVINLENRREDLIKIQNPISEGDPSYTFVNKGGSILKKQKMMHGGEVEIGKGKDYIKDLL